MDRGLCEDLKRDGYDIYVRREFNRRQQKTTEHLGWMTTAATRPPLMSGLAAAIRKQGEPGEGIEILDTFVIRELRSCIVTEKGKEEAAGGFHDDAVIMLGLGIATEEFASIYPFPQRGKEGRDPFASTESGYQSDYR